MPTPPLAIDWSAIEPIDLAPGIKARVVHGAGMTLSLVELDPDTPLPQHQHPQEQAGWILDGAITFDVHDRKETISAGEAYLLGGNVPHGATAGPAGARVLDIFAPCRDDMPGLRWP